MAEWMDMAGDLYGTSVPVKPGVREYLEKLRSAGERMIVVTSAVPVHCRTALDHLGLTPYFERIIFAQELHREKKDPQLWRLSAEMMRVKPEDCTLYDDSVEACRGARAAGMCAVGVFDPFFAGTEPEMRAVCDRYIRSFDELL